MKEWLNDFLSPKAFLVKENFLATNDVASDWLAKIFLLVEPCKDEGVTFRSIIQNAVVLTSPNCCVSC